MDFPKGTTRSTPLGTDIFRKSLIFWEHIAKNFKVLCINIEEIMQVRS